MRTSAYVDQSNMAAKTADWLEKVREQTAPRDHLKLQLSACALLVVDMVRYFCDRDHRCFLPASTAVIPRISKLVEHWRENRGEVVFTRHCHTGKGDLGMLGVFFSDHIHRGEPEAEIIDALTPQTGEAIFEKTTYDSFMGTGLEEHLRSRGISQVLVTGVLTHMCCETTARSAFCRGFQVHVPVDALATTSEERHVGSLLSMADSVAVITGSEEVLAGE